MRELRKVPHAEAKEESGLRSGKLMTAQVVALAVVCRTLGRCKPGLHGPVRWLGCTADDLSCAKVCVLSESRMRGCDLARLRNRVGVNPTQVAVSHGPGIEPCSQWGNPLIDA